MKFYDTNFSHIKSLYLLYTFKDKQEKKTHKWRSQKENETNEMKELVNWNNGDWELRWKMKCYDEDKWSIHTVLSSEYFLQKKELAATK